MITIYDGLYVLVVTVGTVETTPFLYKYHLQTLKVIGDNIPLVF